MAVFVGDLERHWTGNQDLEIIQDKLEIWSLSIKEVLNGMSEDIEYLVDHIHSEQKVYPSMASGVTVTSSATAWTLGSAATIVPANAISSEFDIHWVNLEAESSAAGAVYELVLYGNDTEIARCRFASIGVPATTIFNSFKIITPVQAAGTTITAKLASSNAAADTVDISLSYHTY